MMIGLSIESEGLRPGGEFSNKNGETSFPSIKSRCRILAFGTPSIKPKIRITGQWLERAGFNPGSHVQVTCLAPGVIELRSPDASTVDGTKQLSQEQPDRPF